MKCSRCGRWSPRPGRIWNRRDFEPNSIYAVVVRTWNGHEYGHGGKTALLTHAPVDKPLQPFDDDDARSPIGKLRHQGSRAAVGPGPSAAENGASGTGAYRVLRVDVCLGDKKVIRGQSPGKLSIFHDEYRHKRKFRPPIGGDITDNFPFITLFGGISQGFCSFG
jgi:hypothetical protein